MLATMFQFLGFARYNTTPPTTLNGQPTELQCDAQGNLNVNLAGYGGSAASLWFDGMGFQGIAKNAPGKLGTVYASNEGSAGKVWLMIFDKPTNPANGDVPKVQLPLAAGEDKLWPFRQPRAFALGIVWGVSSTPGVYTALTTAQVWMNVEYT
jgi:hypothetical protein